MDQVLPLLIESAEAARDRQAGALRQAQQAVQQAQDTLARLRQFRADCLARSAGGSLGRADAQSLGDYQRFVARLDQAIVMQQHEAQLRESRVVAAQQQLMQCQQKLLAFQTLTQRRARQREAVATRREQREADEFAARAFQRQSSPLFS